MTKDLCSRASKLGEASVFVTTALQLKPIYMRKLSTYRDLSYHNTIMFSRWC